MPWYQTERYRDNVSLDRVVTNVDMFWRAALEDGHDWLHINCAVIQHLGRYYIRNTYIQKIYGLR